MIRVRACGAVRSPGGCRVTPRMRGAPGRGPDHGQDVGPGAVEQPGGEQVAGQDGLGRRAQELCPGRPGPPRRGADAVGPGDLPYGRRRDVDAPAGQLAVDPAVSPSGGLPGQPQDRGREGPAGGRPAGPCGPGIWRPGGGGRCRGASAGSCPGRPAAAAPGAALWVSRRAGPRAGPGPPSPGAGGAAAAVAGRRAGGAGSRSLRPATPPRAGTAAATWSSA